MDAEEAMAIMRARKPRTMRSKSEIEAQYEVLIAHYNELLNSSSDNREQRMELYAEIKILGWVLAKSEKVVRQELGANHVNR